MKHCDILIIDDDYEDVQFLIEVLTRSGMEQVHFVHTAHEALKYLKEVHPDCLPKVIVTDVLLPGVTGAEFLTHLQAIEEFNHIKVVVLSSIKPKYHGKMFKHLGHLDFFGKPDSLDGYSPLIETIKSKMLL